MRKLILQLTSAAVLLAGCKSGNSRFPGYEEMPNGYYFKMEKTGSGNTPLSSGDVVFLKHIIATDHDSVLFDYSKDNKSGQPFVVQLSKSAYKGDFFEALMQMKTGDSASFALRVDSFFSKFNHKPIPKFLDSTGYLLYHVKIDSSYTAAKVAEIEKKRDITRQAFTEKARLAEDSTLKKYLADNHITEKPTETGLYLIIKEKGKGKKVMKGDPVEVKYKGMLMNGQVFDASDKHPEAFVVAAGTQQVIPAWDEALLTLTEGSKAMVISPSKLAYGPNGSGPIPPYAPLVFELEIIKINPATKPNK